MYRAGSDRGRSFRVTSDEQHPGSSKTIRAKRGGRTCRATLHYTPAVLCGLGVSKDRTVCRKEEASDENRAGFASASHERIISELEISPDQAISLRLQETKSAR
jgi:hypothetical protein